MDVAKHTSAADGAAETPLTWPKDTVRPADLAGLRGSRGTLGSPKR